MHENFVNRHSDQILRVNDEEEFLNYITWSVPVSMNILKGINVNKWYHQYNMTAIGLY